MPSPSAPAPLPGSEPVGATVAHGRDMLRRQFAPAKINLALHVTGRRDDGLHLLDSLVVFADVGDVVTLTPSAGLSLTVTGPFASAIPPGDDNLCLRAALAVGGRGAITLEKNLPPASGIGGGTADAAAVLRALDRYPDRPETLGADLPACLLSQPLRMSGIGEVIEPLGPLPRMFLVLVNPRCEVATPAVFRALSRRDNPALAPLPVAAADAAEWFDWLGNARNDLEPAARSIAPVVGDCLAELAGAGAVLARMSGSGATCFGLFPDAAASRAATARIGAARPSWWVRSCATIAGLTAAGGTR